MWRKQKLGPQLAGVLNAKGTVLLGDCSYTGTRSQPQRKQRGADFLGMKALLSLSKFPKIVPTAETCPTAHVMSIESRSLVTGMRLTEGVG